LNRIRLYDARISGLPEAIGLCNTDTLSITAAVNEAQERLVNDPLAPDEGWWGGWAKYLFNVSPASPYFVTPREVSRVILLDACKRPVPLRNSFWEFLEFGRGYQSGHHYHDHRCEEMEAYDRETVVTAAPLASTPQTLRLYATNPADYGIAVLFQGEDQNSNEILFTDVVTGKAGLGEPIILANPFTDSINQYTEIKGIQKSATLGPVQIFQVDPVSGAESLLLQMEPNELVAQYRKYLVARLPNECHGQPIVQVRAQCKLDYIPAVTDTDYLRIQSIPALIDQCMSVRYGRMDTAQAQQLAGFKHQSALRILFGQLDNYLGKQQTAIQRHIEGSSWALMRQPR
jgi:hypothetical protein